MGRLLTADVRTVDSEMLEQAVSIAACEVPELAIVSDASWQAFNEGLFNALRDSEWKGYRREKLRRDEAIA